MMEALTVILLCQLAGELAVAATGVPLPGPVVGMLLLLVGLGIRGAVPGGLARTAGALLENLSLLFVPAGVGVMTHLTLLGEEWWPVSLSLVVSTLLTIAVTGILMSRLARRRDGAGGSRGDAP